MSSKNSISAIKTRVQEEAEDIVTLDLPLLRYKDAIHVFFPCRVPFLSLTPGGYRVESMPYVTEEAELRTAGVALPEERNYKYLMWGEEVVPFTHDEIGKLPTGRIRGSLVTMNLANLLQVDKDLCETGCIWRESCTVLPNGNSKAPVSAFFYTGLIDEEEKLSLAKPYRWGPQEKGEPVTWGFSPQPLVARKYS